MLYEADENLSRNEGESMLQLDGDDLHPKSPLRNSNGALKMQVGGNHYKSMVIQPSVYCQRNKFNHLESTVIKYVSRHGLQGGRKDIEKAIHCLELLLELEYDDVT